MRKLSKISCLVLILFLGFVLAFLLFTFWHSRVPSSTIPDRPIQEKPLRVHALSAVFADSLQKSEK
ncbi:MAG: hypothetical protein E6713_12135 [Sporomusaceae bacterium]|nr:hypothetical protein [Sporomusaceae bacterium]